MRQFLARFFLVTLSAAVVRDYDFGFHDFRKRVRAVLHARHHAERSWLSQRAKCASIVLLDRVFIVLARVSASTESVLERDTIVLDLPPGLLCFSRTTSIVLFSSITAFVA